MKRRQIVFVIALGLLAGPASADDKAGGVGSPPPMSDRERIAADRAKADAEIKQNPARPWDRDANGRRPWDTEQRPAGKQ